MDRIQQGWTLDGSYKKRGFSFAEVDYEISTTGGLTFSMSVPVTGQIFFANSIHQKKKKRFATRVAALMIRINLHVVPILFIVQYYCGI